MFVSKRHILASLTARQREIEATTGEQKQRPKHGRMSHELALLDARLAFLGYSCFRVFSSLPVRGNFSVFDEWEQPEAYAHHGSQFKKEKRKKEKKKSVFSLYDQTLIRLILFYFVHIRTILLK